MVMSINLTANEIAVMCALANNYYGDNGDSDNGDGVWSWAINDSYTPSDVTGKSLSGTVSSLIKKGLISSQEFEKNEDVIWMNDSGKAYIIENDLVIVLAQ